MSRSRKSPARVDNSCRNHGSCPWCVGNRLHKHRKAEPLLEFGRTIDITVTLSKPVRVLYPYGVE